MTESKKPTLSLDAIQAKHLRSILGVDINGVSSALEQARATLADAGNFAQAQRLLRENSTMTSFSAKELLRIEVIGTRLDPYKDVRELLHTNVSIQAVIDAAKQHENLTASLANSLQTAQLFSTQLERYRHITTQHEANFRLPQTGEVARLLADMRFDNGSVAAFARKHLGDIAAQTNLITSMSRPWLQEIEAARSAAALLELHGIGSALQSTQGFDDTLTIALRADLGDWRDRITFPSLVFDDPVARTEFYIERGFNSALTDFPDDTFQESLVMFGLDTDVQEVVDWPEAMHATDDIEESE